MFQIFSSKKSFATPWIGNPLLNKFALHNFRIKLSDACLKVRQWQTRQHSEHLATLQRDGIVVIKDFLPESQFLRLQQEALLQFQQAEQTSPIPTQSTIHGFGSKQKISNGFDRYDGSTLNRFISINSQRTPQCSKLIKHPQLQTLYQKAAGTKAKPHKFWLYQTLQGLGEQEDGQRLLHRDTFHSCIKIWFFLDDVSEENGPFQYVKGSHIFNRKRHHWEYVKSCRASNGRSQTGGAFRANKADQRYLGLAKPESFPVKANTLVLADVRGFHRRGLASQSKSRFGIYASIRLHPFMPIKY